MFTVGSSGAVITGVPERKMYIWTFKWTRNTWQSSPSSLGKDWECNFFVIQDFLTIKKLLMVLWECGISVICSWYSLSLVGSWRRQTLIFAVSLPSSTFLSFSVYLFLYLYDSLFLTLCVSLSLSLSLCLSLCLLPQWCWVVMEAFSLLILVISVSSFFTFQWLFHRVSPGISSRVSQGFLALSDKQKVEWNSRYQLPLPPRDGFHEAPSSVCPQLGLFFSFA